ncbi:MAG TPA: 2-oxoacid:acceptor oxidoreductase family protein [Gaiellaceae bacterium]
MLLVGRGGEGVVLASQLLAEALAGAGHHVQAFPEFKAERRGAPIAASLRWDDRPIHRRYKVRACDVLAVVTPAPPTPAQLSLVRRGGTVVLNREERFPVAGPFRVARVPASRIAQANGIMSAEGRPMGNTALLGACVRVLEPTALPWLEDAVAARIGTRNAAAARAGFESCTRQHELVDDEPFEAVAPARHPETPLFPVSTVDSRANHTGSWSLDRPVLLDPCNACGLCALFCPEGAIAREDGVMAVDYLYCKGCGICETVCPVRGALAMEAVA